MISLQEKRANPPKLALLPLVPMTVVVSWVMLYAFLDHSGPRHGKIRLALAIIAFVGLTIAWFVALSTEGQPQHRRPESCNEVRP